MNSRTQVKRSPMRGVYDQGKIFKILDDQFMCHVGIVYQNNPLVIPTMYGRKEDYIYIHGATVSRLIQQLKGNVELCISIACVNGLVLARSAFHHSMNYESVVIFGKGTLVKDGEKIEALKVISDHLIPGRWEEVRLPNKTELKATSVIKVKLDEFSGKVREGGPIDNSSDYSLDVWAGTLPLKSVFEDPIADKRLKKDIKWSKSIKQIIKS